jgi:Ca-activated chloride channel family protein
MRLTFENYWPLILLGIIPWLWWALRSTAVDLSVKHLRLSTAIRSLLILLLASALMQPLMRLSRNDLSVVYLLDVSQSIASPAIQDAMQWIQQTNAAGKPGDSRFIAFGSDSMTFENLDDLKHVKVSGQGTGDSARGVIDQNGTNIAAALDKAAHSFAAGHLKRLVLFTDGNDNSGNLSEAVSRLESDGVHVYTLPMQPRSTGDTWIEAIKTPSTVTADEQFPLEVHVYSQLATDGEVTIRNGDKILDRRSVHLAAGMNRIAFETSLKEQAGAVVLEAEVKANGDSFTENNSFREPIIVEGRPRVLYVEGNPPSARYLRDALNQEGFVVDVASPASLPSELTKLDAYDAIVLSDIDPKMLSKTQMQVVSTYVRDLGGGLILAGGENIYGEDGYSKTDIEDALPVKFEVRKKPPSVAMVVVLDASGSMNGAKIEVAKGASKAPLDMMRPRDTYGAIVFNNTFTWAVPMQSAGNKKEISDSIGRISAGGGTDAYPALNAAYTALTKATDEIKIAILLTDGETPPQPFQTLTQQMNKAGITVSTVAIGAEANRELLTDIAMWGRGRAYYIDNVNNIPQIFIHETELALAQTLRETPFKPVVNKPVDAFKGIDFKTAPALMGYVATQAKPTSEVLLGDSLANEPLLARWQYGLGKSAAFTSDVKDRWAVDWLGWSGYPKFWAQLVREIMRRRGNDTFDFHVVREKGVASISINAIEKDGRFRNDLQTQISMIDPTESASLIDVPQTGPGRYETQIPLTQEGSYTFRAVGKGSGSPPRVITRSYPDEYHFYPVNTGKLQAISTSTGGVFQPKGPEVFDRKGETAILSIALWPWFAAFALTLFVLDVMLRRLRLFE